MTKENFIERAIITHDNKYDYSKVEYIDIRTKVCIICPIHGEFWQTPANHLRGRGCLECAKIIRAKKTSLSTEEFIKRAKEIHGDKYDYSKVEYKNAYTKVCIICPIHGEFWITPNNHLRGRGCKECYRDSLFSSTNEFIKKAKKVHGDKYDYSKVEYKNDRTKICIICSKHGEFWQTPAHHLKGCGCQYCSKNKKYTTEEFIKRAKEIHGDKYDYSKVEYKNTSTKVCIICPKHGEFLVTPNNHLSGRGCPHCKQTLLEKRISNVLDNNGIKYIYECGNATLNWLDGQRLDFYLPDYNIAIECQGEQHFYPIDFANKGKEWAQKSLERNRKLDKEKNKKCTENNVRLLYFAAKKYNSSIITEENEILDYLGL